jgi:hypothetical protein
MAASDPLAASGNFVIYDSHSTKETQSDVPLEASLGRRELALRLSGPLDHRTLFVYQAPRACFVSTHTSTSTSSQRDAFTDRKLV